jgi:cytoplasmic iron level regulating protein YaaA (DUF328/UPF0246 family)
MDFEAPAGTDRCTEPAFLEDAADLAVAVAALDRGALAELMRISPDLAEGTAARFQSWRRSSHDSRGDTKQAIFAYRGEVYRGLDVDTLDEDSLIFAQRHLRILSGLYGILRPLDLILPYRLEMATRIANDRGATLYDFWGGELGKSLREDVLRAGGDHRVIVDLSSQEYIRAVRREDLDLPVITPVFRDFRNGRWRSVAMYAKHQRGAMARFIVTRRITDPEELKGYTNDGYRYDPDGSTAEQWAFVR